MDLNFSALKRNTFGRDEIYVPSVDNHLLRPDQASCLIEYREDGVVLRACRYEPEMGCYVAPLLAKLPARPMPETGAEEIAVKAILREYGETLVGPRGCTVYGACICP